MTPDEQIARLREENATLTAKLKTAEEALDGLCKLKEYKDKNGKDEHYTAIRQGVWEAAQEALAQIRGEK